MKLNEPEKRKLDRQNSWQSAKHTKRYSDLAQPYTTGHFITVDSQQKIWRFLGVWFICSILPEKTKQSNFQPPKNKLKANEANT